MTRRVALISLLLTVAGIPTSAQQAPIRPPALDSAGVAYRTTKGMIRGLRSVDVVGVTPARTVSLEPVPGAGDADDLGVVVPRVGPGGMVAAPGEHLELWALIPLAAVTP